MALTDLQLKKMSGKTKRYYVADGGGLYVRIETSGAKYFEYRYVFDGIRKRLTIGAYPALSLAEARGKHQQAIQDVKLGIDPGAKEREKKAKRKAAPTFQDIIDELWEVELIRKKSGNQTRALLEKNAVPSWGKRKVADIKRRDIVLLLDKIQERGAPIVRNRVHGALSRLFNFAAERGVIEDSPCTRIRKVPEKGRSRVLDDDEIKAVWKALDLENKAVDMYRVSKLALKMILLTGQRPGEVCGMSWAEIDGDFWNIPAERMKNDEPNRVPLCPMSLEVIEQAKVYSDPECPYVFRSSYKPKEAIDRHSLSRAVKRHWAEMKSEDSDKAIEEAFTPHDLRRTLRTKLAELGVIDIVAEMVLGHKLQGMMAVYNRHAYDLEKRQALMKWEGRLKEILGLTTGPSNVIPFEVRHA